MHNSESTVSSHVYPRATPTAPPCALHDGHWSQVLFLTPLLSLLHPSDLARKCQRHHELTFLSLLTQVLFKPCPWLGFSCLGWHRLLLLLISGCTRVFFWLLSSSITHITNSQHFLYCVLCTFSGFCFPGRTPANMRGFYVTEACLLNTNALLFSHRIPQMKRILEIALLNSQTAMSGRKRERAKWVRTWSSYPCFNKIIVNICLLTSTGSLPLKRVFCRCSHFL